MVLTDDCAHTTQFTDLIGEFVLKNEHNQEIQTGLNKIREGSILYVGISHNIDELGSITKPLTLYLGTEILFSLAGYNGVIYQQFANDFYDQVRTANIGKSPKIRKRASPVLNNNLFLSSGRAVCLKRTPLHRGNGVLNTLLYYKSCTFIRLFAMS